MENLDALLHGFAIALTLQHLALMVVGVLLGILVGVLPGLGAPNGVSLLLPLTFGMHAGLGHHPALQHVLGRAVRRLRDVDPVQHPGRAVLGRDDLRRLSDGARRARRRTALATAFGSAAFGALVGVVLITLLAVLGRPGGARLRPAGVFRRLFPGLRELHRHGRRAADEDAGVAGHRLRHRGDRHRHRVGQRAPQLSASTSSSRA